MSDLMAKWIRHKTCDSGVVSSSPAMGNFFYFVILGFRSLQTELAHANEINHDLLRSKTLFYKKVR